MLVVAGEYPWPLNSGSRRRLSAVLTGLSGLGSVDLFSVVPAVRTEFDPPPPTSTVTQATHVGFDDRPPQGSERLRLWLGRAWPMQLPRRHHPELVRAFEEFLATGGEYDLVWFYGVRPWVFLGDLCPRPSVLDLDDLEDYKIAAFSRMPRHDRRGVTGIKRVIGWARAMGAQWLLRGEIARWRRLQRRASADNTLCVVCSELDARRARTTGLDPVEVVVNSYPQPDPPVGRSDVGAPPTLVFPGTLKYPPNAYGASWFVSEITPLLAQTVPDATLRIVGVSTLAVNALADPPRVVVVGPVGEIADELAQADAVVVPLHFGSGTRLKVLEAFAHRLPVVSTTLGAEGLGAEDEVHLLVADTAEAFALACQRVLTDRSLRLRLVDAAESLYRENFESALAAARVAEVARQVMESNGAAGD